MSTRSGKRIHSSFHEGTMKFEEELVKNIERKTRSKRLKENDRQLDVTLPKTKKLNNYVRYPSDDDSNSNTIVTETGKVKSTRKLRRNTLKDHNLPATGGLDSDIEVKKAGRPKRRTKKFADNCEDTLVNAEVVETNESEVVSVKKLKKSKKIKKKSKDVSVPDNEMVNGDVAAIPVKKSKLKKKNKQSNSITEEDHIKDKKTNSLNKSTSIDSFYSAAGSPIKESPVKNSTNEDPEEIPPAIIIETNRMFKKDAPIADIMINSICNSDKKKRKTSLQNLTFDKIENTSTQTLVNDLNSTYDKNMSAQTTDQLNATYEKEPEARPSKPTTDSHNNTLANTCNNGSKTASLNSTYDKNDAESTEKLNATFEKEPAVQKSTRGKLHTEILNDTLEKTKHSETSLNSTYEKDAKPKLDTTFDKSQSKSNSAKSSVISSDATINVTFDKSNDNSRISITSDDSKTENIINTTPVLIESSMDESHISNTVNETCIQEWEVPEKTPPTIVREGTFTKDSPDGLVASPKANSSMERTPTMRMTLPSPGFTPFHTSRSSQIEKSAVNVTRSIEKPLRRSMSVEVAPRQTKVMFCSPVNNQDVVMQQTRKIIKSSLKGSNKSFLFDESVSASEDKRGRAAVGRKRSLTQNDAEDAHAKRKRLAGNELQHSMNRLARPRTSSAAAKLAEATPTKKPLTPSSTCKPSSKPPRTKLPNFAALHQRRFDRMESLDECQERKRKRARQLLTPTGGVAVLDRSSPRGITLEPVKEPQKTPKKETTPKETAAKKPTTGSKTLPTLDSLRPGYTRFGFKMNVGVNPFSVPSKSETKPKGIKPNGPKGPIKPSVAGSTLNRKEIAKQTVLREKSFTSLSGMRDAKRSENRTIIKGVRTNRRFELQMKMRDLN